MIRILNAEPAGYSADARKILHSLGDVEEISLLQQDLADALHDKHVLITRLGLRVGREVLDAAPALRVVVSATTGLDHIDLERAAERGVAVLSLRGETEFLRTVRGTAEHTWALLLALIRKIPAAHASVLRGEWTRDSFRGTELGGKSLGIVGVGRLGEKVARYGLCFEMQVHGHDPSPARVTPGVAYHDSLAELLPLVDVLSLHVPLNSETTRLIGRRELALLRPGALLVNTSRGAVLDEEALLATLRSGHLAGAAVDVLEGETEFPLGRVSPLVEYAKQHDHLLITPHIGGATHESMERAEIFMARKLERHLRTELHHVERQARSS